MDYLEEKKLITLKKINKQPVCWSVGVPMIDYYDSEYATSLAFKVQGLH